MGTRNRTEEPFAFDAKEFVRKKLIGKKATVVIEYSRLPIPAPSGVVPQPSDASGRLY